MIEQLKTFLEHQIEIERHTRAKDSSMSIAIHKGRQTAFEEVLDLINYWEKSL